MCLKRYEFDPGKFLSAPGLVWQTALKKTKVRLDLLADIEMLLMIKIYKRRIMPLYLSIRKS